ncbi:MAG: hypothetical protein IBX50_06880 [Marinospirillum sp.]|nr:hypothetical protein [Marinospirillum sp.]MBE0506430.1 hypothetical protein [Marinospirillum sp.]
MTDYLALGKSCKEKEDYEEAARYYQLAAEQGDAKGQCQLGALYLTGQRD